MGFFVAWAGLLLVAAGDPAPSAPSAEQVKTIIRQLDAQQLTERNEAESKLLSLGPAVLPLLPTVGENTSAETVLRVTRVQQKLLEAQANAEAEPSLITMHAVEMPLAQVLAAISKQTGNPIVDHRQAFGQRADDILISVDLDKVPFWKALDQVLDQAGLTLYGYAGRRGAFAITRSADEARRAARAAYAGSFRLEPARFEAVRDLRNPAVKSLKLFLEVTWEPRLQPYAILQPLDEIKAVGSDGQEIALGSAVAVPEAAVRPGNSVVELEIPLELPPRGTETIRSLKGKLWALVPGAAADFRFPNLRVADLKSPAKRVEQRKAGATVGIDGLRRNNETWEVSMRVRFDNPSDSLESHRGWILENPAYFERPDGTKIEPIGLEQTLQTKNELGLHYYFDLPDDPSKLTFVYSTPVTILEIPVDYELRDLRLP